MDKPVVWMGQSKKELVAMPDDVKDEFGYAIGEAQAGRTAPSAKPMSGNLRDVMEIVSNEKGDTLEGHPEPGIDFNCQPREGDDGSD